jgi:hypothetical protein
MRRRKVPSPGRHQRPAQTLPTRALPKQTPRAQTPSAREDSTKRCGEISELAFTLAAARHRFGVSRPYGDSERYDVILDCHRCHPPDLAPPTSFLDPGSRPRLVRVQVKATTQLVDGLYRVNTHRRINGRAVPYKLSEIDFIVAHVIPEDAWFIFPLPHILGLTSLLLSPKTRRRPGLYDNYREAWHLLRQPDGIEFA